jgi:hypothetical protein
MGQAGWTGTAVAAIQVVTSMLIASGMLRQLRSGNVSLYGNTELGWGVYCLVNRRAACLHQFLLVPRHWCTPETQVWGFSCGCYVAGDACLLQKSAPSKANSATS